MGIHITTPHYCPTTQNSTFHHTLQVAAHYLFLYIIYYISLLYTMWIHVTTPHYCPTAQNSILHHTLQVAAHYSTLQHIMYSCAHVSTHCLYGYARLAWCTLQHITTLHYCLVDQYNTYFIYGYARLELCTLQHITCYVWRGFYYLAYFGGYWSFYHGITSNNVCIFPPGCSKHVTWKVNNHISDLDLII